VYELKKLVCLMNHILISWIMTPCILVDRWQHSGRPYCQPIHGTNRYRYIYQTERCHI